MSIKLNANGPLEIKNVKLLYAFFAIPYKAVRGDEFCIHEVSPVGLADPPERRISDIFHWSKKERSLTKRYVSNSQNGDF
jgi:hypothetical protein